MNCSNFLPSSLLISEISSESWSYFPGRSSRYKSLHQYYCCIVHPQVPRTHYCYGYEYESLLLSSSHVLITVIPRFLDACEIERLRILIIWWSAQQSLLHQISEFSIFHFTPNHLSWWPKEFQEEQRIIMKIYLTTIEILHFN